MQEMAIVAYRPKLTTMSHLTREQRYTIAAMKQAGHSQKSISEAIGKDKSVVSRELSRNCDGRSGEYRADLAQRKCEQRRKCKPHAVRFTEPMRLYVESKLGEKMSPEQIAGQASEQGLDCVSPERIYQHVWQDKRKGGILYTHLRHQGKKYRKRGAAKDSRGVLKDRVGIAQRPESVERREQFGDLEVDTIIGKDHKGAILTINDRALGVVKIRKLAGKDAKELADAMILALLPWKGLIRTITSDNGKEFAEHKAISQALGIDFFFAEPYKSWQRGSNENLNGLIRQYIPKKTNFDDLSDEYIQWVEEQLNRRPRKRFSFKSPLDMFNQKVAFAA
jgi:transposase, IS30 family